jgi:predicted subunit of tRNA(5-methylaminomethyl-2-thiouridylate) methyltransferase
MGVPIIQEGFDHEAFAQGHQIISEHEAHERYDDMLDDCHEDVKICGMTYNTARALKDVDPIAYRCGFSDYTASLEEDNIFVEGITYPPNS